MIHTYDQEFKKLGRYLKESFLKITQTAAVHKITLILDARGHNIEI